MNDTESRRPVKNLPLPKGAWCCACQHYTGYIDKYEERNPTNRLTVGKVGRPPKIKTELKDYLLDDSNFVQACKEYPPPSGIPKEIWTSKDYHIDSDTDYAFAPKPLILYRQISDWQAYTKWAQSIPLAVDGDEPHTNIFKGKSLQDTWTPIVEFILDIYIDPSRHSILLRDVLNTMVINHQQEPELIKIIDNLRKRINKEARRRKRSSADYTKSGYKKFAPFMMIQSELLGQQLVDQEAPKALDYNIELYSTIFRRTLYRSIHLQIYPDWESAYTLEDLSIISLIPTYGPMQSARALLLISNGLSRLSADAISRRFYRHK